MAPRRHPPRRPAPRLYLITPRIEHPAAFAEELAAALGAADPDIAGAAQRRLGIVREVLHTLTTPKFGRRDIPLRQPTPEERHRQLLGLPLDCRLTLAEIHRAYKRVAKSAHPDAGGSAQQFQALSAAREALMKVR